MAWDDLAQVRGRADRWDCQETVEQADHTTLGAAEAPVAGPLLGRVRGRAQLPGGAQPERVGGWWGDAGFVARAECSARDSGIKRGLHAVALVGLTLLLGGCVGGDPGFIGVGWEADGEGATTVWFGNCRGEFDPPEGYPAPTSLRVQVVPDVYDEASPVTVARLRGDALTATRSPDGLFWLVTVHDLPRDDLLSVSTPYAEDGPWFGVMQLSGSREPLSMLTGEEDTEEVVEVTPEQLFNEVCQYR